MKINGIEVCKPVELLQQTIYACPYCSKKFLNKGSYYNHIKGKYCMSYFMDFEIETQKFTENKITEKEYWSWCYENGYIEFLDLKKATVEKLGQEFYDKICSLYDYREEDY